MFFFIPKIICYLLLLFISQIISIQFIEKITRKFIKNKKFKKIKDKFSSNIILKI